MNTANIYYTAISDGHTWEDVASLMQNLSKSDYAAAGQSKELIEFLMENEADLGMYLLTPSHTEYLPRHAVEFPLSGNDTAPFLEMEGYRLNLLRDGDTDCVLSSSPGGSCVQASRQDDGSWTIVLIVEEEEGGGGPHLGRYYRTFADLTGEVDVTQTRVAFCHGWRGHLDVESAARTARVGIS